MFKISRTLYETESHIFGFYAHVIFKERVDGYFECTKFAGLFSNWLAINVDEYLRDSQYNVLIQYLNGSNVMNYRLPKHNNYNNIRKIKRITDDRVKKIERYWNHAVNFYSSFMSKCY